MNNGKIDWVTVSSVVSMATIVLGVVGGIAAPMSRNQIIKENVTKEVAAEFARRENWNKENGGN